MKGARVVTINEYKRLRLTRAQAAREDAAKVLPVAAGQLWELLDRNISIEVWKKGI